MGFKGLVVRSLNICAIILLNRDVSGGVAGIDLQHAAHDDGAAVISKMIVYA